MSLRLGFDVDGVLADFRTAFAALAERHHLEPDDSDPSGAASRDLRRLWDRVGRIENWWLSLAAYEPGEIGRLYTLSRQHRWEVFFLTCRPASAGESVLVQTQWWLERHGFYLPAVVTVPGSRGELANALRLDLVVDDQFANCADVISASTTKALLMLRGGGGERLRDQATSRGVGVVATLAEAIAVVERLQAILPERRGRLRRLVDWFGTTAAEAQVPLDPRPYRAGTAGGAGGEP
ncbi:MAG TPA: hypothetical protein VNI83_12830 [Vicinamibacterales bacterium]|nr:hypothetical protein [Vicinamibacterales bacterium]